MVDKLCHANQHLKINNMCLPLVRNNLSYDEYILSLGRGWGRDKFAKNVLM